VIAATLVQDWWQAGLAIIFGILAFYGVRNAIRRTRHERAQTAELRTEWETYQRRRDL